MHAPRPAARVLVVDRHRSLHDGIAGALTGLDHAVSRCRTAGEALDLASVGGPLVLLVTEIDLPIDLGFAGFNAANSADIPEQRDGGAISGEMVVHDLGVTGTTMEGRAGRSFGRPGRCT